MENCDFGLPVGTNYVNDKSKFLKTGTTICGLICNHGEAVVVACDSRATAGPIVADKDCMKLHKLAQNIYCGGAGTAADLTHVTNFIATKLGVHGLTTGTFPRVKTAVTMFKRHLFQYGGHLGVYLVLGGYDCTGAHLYGLMANGYTSEQHYYSLGSGSVAATTILDDGWNEGLTIEEGAALAQHAIEAGILNDMGSGSRVRVCIITKDGVDERLHVSYPCPRIFRNPDFKGFPKKLELVKKTFVPTIADNDINAENNKMEID
ncbi:proteasome subunit beta type-7-A precursor, putative [Entamoeba invadens IP1]|uniref:proteasome endopeptidase complex n=1 Tax=Entamoeba invadens IP1 TaxID=370355 RepID=A0A0A1UB03_ENTIV|nr:proteasome subunit beta type-7-A precursor, putative [Entamoeba invadens IP1]ELP92175.1 proteasome subunit beta type-7-A precursor, putative [Entamoeba invadens IP1]|eukprot:XP_004258946.1 proteasome subunit beta type-7-A precursor, putative [Entamoeba invadens IP1]